MTSTAWLILTWVRPGPATFLVLPFPMPTLTNGLTTPLPKLGSLLGLLPIHHPSPACSLDPSSHPLLTPHPVRSVLLSPGTTCTPRILEEQHHSTHGETGTMTALKLHGDAPQPPDFNPSSFHPCPLDPLRLTPLPTSPPTLASVPRSGRPERSHQERSRRQYQPSQPRWAREEAGDQAPEHGAEKARGTALRQNSR